MMSHDFFFNLKCIDSSFSVCNLFSYITDEIQFNGSETAGLKNFRCLKKFTALTITGEYYRKYRNQCFYNLAHIMDHKHQDISAAFVVTFMIALVLNCWVFCPLRQIIMPDFGHFKAHVFTSYSLHTKYLKYLLAI